MKTLYLDANILLRILLKDDEESFERAQQYFMKARQKKIQLVLLSEIILEVQYVLRKVYSISRKETGQILKKIIRTLYIDCPDRHLYDSALDLYIRFNIDLVDIILFKKAQAENAKVLSFDSDFKILEKEDKS